MRGTGPHPAAHRALATRRHGALLLLASITGLLAPLAVAKPAVASSGDAYSAAVMADNPAAYWRLDEGTNTSTAHDQVGQTDGSPSSGVTRGQTGALSSSSDTANSFDGSSGYIGLTPSAQVEPTSALSVEVWEKSPAPTSISQSLIRLRCGGGCYTFGIDPSSANGDAFFCIVDSGGTYHCAIGTSNIADNTWHHVVGTWDGSAVKVYVDGTLQTTTSTSATFAYGSVWDMALGRDGNDPDYYFDGTMDEAAIYPSALTSTQISNHHTNGTGSSATFTGTGYRGQVASDNPVSYWPMDDTSGSVITDVLNQSYGVIHGGVTLNQQGGRLLSPAPGASFDGSSGYIDLAPASAEQPATGLTVEAWEKSPAPESSSQTLVRMVCSVGCFTFGIQPSSSNGETFFCIVDSGNSYHCAIGTTSIADGTWHDVAGTWDGTAVKVYVDGKLQTTTTTAAAIYYGAVSEFGLGGASSGYYLDGSLADVALYPSALSADRIAHHFAASGRTYPLPSNVPSTDHLGATKNPAGACSSARPGTQGDPVDTESGNFADTFTDMAIQGRSCPLEIARTYNSATAATNGPFGYGWTYNYGMSLACSGTTATITQETGAQVSFTTAGTCSSGTWTPAASWYTATLSYSGGTWTVTRQNRDTYTFNASGQLTSITDLNGYTTSLSYTSGNLTTITDPAGRMLTLGWTGAHITSLTDANVTPNRTVSYSYTSDQLTNVTDAASGDTSFAYDGSHRITTMKDPVCEALGGACPGIQNHYDGSSRVDWQKDQLDRETTFSYAGTPGDAAGGTTTTTDPKGNVTVEGYEYGVRTFITRGYGTADAATTSFLYDPATLVLTGTLDPNGNLANQTVDAAGNVLTTTDPLGHVTTNTYNAFNEVLTTEDGNGKTTTNTYDGDGNLSTTSRPVSGASCTCEVITYNHANGTYPGDVTSMVDGDSKTTYYHYDGNGYQDEVKDPNANVTGTVRNADGFMTSSYTGKANCTWNSSPPTGCSSTYETDYTSNAFGQPLTTTDPLSHVTTDAYDADGNKTSVEDGNGSATTYRYDVANEQCWVLPGGTSSNSCASVPTNGRAATYNDDGTVAAQKDGKGNTLLSYGYDHLARVTTVTDALSNVTTLTYDANGNKLTKQDPGGNCATPTKCTTMTYDAGNELATVTYSDGVTPNITSITYDSDGQRTGMSDGTGSPTWSYDNLHRLTSYTSGNGDTVGYTYNLRNEPLTITYPNSVGTVTYGYDNAARMTSVEDWNSKTTTFGYDASNNLTSNTVPSTTNVTDTFGFNAADQMTSVSDSNGSTLFSATYTRDSNGQLASDSSQAANQRDYKYTALNQLCYAGSATSNACASPPTSSYPYAFDNADNLTTMEDAGHGGSNTQQFNNADELCWTVSGASGNACNSAPAGATTFGYDDRGNRTSKVPSGGSATCTAYDQADRLTSVKTGTGSSCTSPTTVGTYAYDGDGLRASKTVSGTTTHFTWDESGSLPMLLQEKAGSATSYIYGPGGLPVEQIAGSTTTYLHHDQIGSTVLVTDSAGATGTATTNNFDPYGNVVATSGSLTTNLMFQGQYLDAETGDYQLRARYYDPTTAQFLSLDPAVSSTLSPYAYVAGNPLNSTDSSGLLPCKNGIHPTCPPPPPPSSRCANLWPIFDLGRQPVPDLSNGAPKAPAPSGPRPNCGSDGSFSVDASGNYVCTYTVHDTGDAASTVANAGGATSDACALSGPFYSPAAEARAGCIAGGAVVAATGLVIEGVVWLTRKVAGG